MQELSGRMTKKIDCWIVTEGIAGTENQCIGVAESLGVDADIKRIQLRQPWKSLSPYIGFEQSWSFSPALSGPWPDLVIASGRKSIAASRFIKKASAGKSFTVQIQDPRIPPEQFDLVAVPAHDPTRGDNVIVTTAAPNKVTQNTLDTAKKNFSKFEKLTGPRIAVLIGGSSKAYTMTAKNIQSLAAQLKAIEGSLMITTSRRTGLENKNILQDTLGGAGHYFWDGTGENPYLGLLAWADFILVTADSASMLSEACTTGKPVYMIPLDSLTKGGHPRIDKLHENLRQSGGLKNFEGQLEQWSYEPLDDAALVAHEIRKRMKL